jgi:hypothetical protein
MDDSFMLVAIGLALLVLLPIIAVGLSESRSHRRQRALAVRRKDRHRL